MKAPRLEDGEWVKPVRRGFIFMCCDCGLTHRMDFRVRVRKGRAELHFRGTRDGLRTANARRRKDLPTRMRPR